MLSRMVTGGLLSIRLCRSRIRFQLRVESIIDQAAALQGFEIIPADPTQPPADQVKSQGGRFERDFLYLVGFIHHLRDLLQDRILHVLRLEKGMECTMTTVMRITGARDIKGFP